MNNYRILQLVTFIHYIHHYVYSYGFKFPFIDYGYFRKFGIKKLGKTKGAKGEVIISYHNCTLSNIY